MTRVAKSALVGNPELGGGHAPDGVAAQLAFPVSGTFTVERLSLKSRSRSPHRSQATAVANIN
jgi:hypothetical protein